MAAAEDAVMCSSTKSPSESAPKTNNPSQESCHEHVDLLGGVYAHWFAEGSLLNVPSKRHTSTGTLPSDPAVSGRLTSGGTHSLCLDCAQTSANPPPNTPITSNTASLEILENLGGVWGRLGERVPALRLLIRGSEAHQRLSCVRRSLRSRCMHHRHNAGLDCSWETGPHCDHRPQVVGQVAHTYPIRATHESGALVCGSAHGVFAG